MLAQREPRGEPRTWGPLKMTYRSGFLYLGFGFGFEALVVVGANEKPPTTKPIVQANSGEAEHMNLTQPTETDLVKEPTEHHQKKNHSFA